MYPEFFYAQKIEVLQGKKKKVYCVGDSNHKENFGVKIEGIKIQVTNSVCLSGIKFADGKKIYFLHPHIVSFEERDKNIYRGRSSK